MKHTLKITLMLVLLFFVAQFVGLLTVNNYIQVETQLDGTIEIVHVDTVVGEQPDIPNEEKPKMVLFIVLAILFGTGLILLLIKFRLGKLWKLWFFLAIALTLSISFGVYLTKWFALTIGFALALIRIFKPNVFIHNLTEIFVYTGITIIILPLLNVNAAIILLVLISIYDMIAVWKSKHMIKMAKFQLKSKMFAGLSMNYSVPKSRKSVKSKKGKKVLRKTKTRSAILGGGDIAFPLIFAAAVMEHLITVVGLTKLTSLFLSFSVTLGAGLGLLLLFMYSKKDTFYPAMPFISMGCFAGWGTIILILTII